MVIKFKELRLTNFKNHKRLVVDFGEITKILGDNGQGKSSIGEAISYIFFGVDLMGGKFDPSPLNYPFDVVKAELLLTIEEKQVLLGRGIEKGKTVYFLNEIPSKATEYDSHIASLFDRDLFLSLLAPQYFPSLHWETQRKLVLQYVSQPSNKEVFGAMIPAQAEKVAELVKKHSIDDLQKLHSKNKTDKDREHIAAQSRIKTLQDQLASITLDTFDKDAAIARIKEIDALIESHNASYADAGRIEAKIQQARTSYDMLARQIKNIREAYSTKKEQQPNDTCHTCGQSLPEEAREKAFANHNEMIDSMREQHNKLLEEAKAVKGQLESLTSQEPVEKLDITALHEEKSTLQRMLRENEMKAQLEQQIEQAKQSEADTLKSRNDSIFILDAIKEFHAKSAELQAAKVQSLFKNLSLRLFKENKGDGEIKPDFELMFDGKPYRKLSLSESIRAGLELRDVLSEQSGIVVPCFLDNSESVTRFKQPVGQLIISRVVAGQELKIESEEI